MDGKIKAKDASMKVWVKGGGRGEGGHDGGEMRRGTKDDENATGKAGARSIEEPNTRPQSARAWLAPKEVLRTFGGLSLRQHHAVKMLLPHPGDELDEFPAREAGNI